MRAGKSTFYIWSLAGALLLAAISGFAVRTRSSFVLGLDWTGRTADNYSVFSASLTNSSDVAVVLYGLRFEWMEISGQVEGGHLIPPGRKCTVRPKEVITGLFAVPANAKSARVVICTGPGAIRKCA